MRNILVVAYQLHYSLGSEYATAWNYVKNMAQNNSVIVLYGTSGGHHEIGNTVEMEEYLSANPVPGLRAIAVQPSFKSHNYDYSIWGISMFYREYRNWHRDVLNVVKDIVSKEHIDIIHYHGPLGFREPGFLYEMNIPYIWGPVGGFDGIKFPLLSSTQTVKSFITQFYKVVANKTQQRTNKRVRYAVKNSDVVIGATGEYLKAIERIAGKKHHSKLVYMPESYVTSFHPLQYEKFNNLKTIQFLWASRVDSQKGLILFLKALRKLPNNLPIHLNVAHTGPLEESSKEWSKQNKIDHYISWLGKVDKSELNHLYENSHVHVLTSLVDANTVVMWESMSYGLPTIALDHCGMHDVITSTSGFLIPVTNVEKITNDIAKSIMDMVNDPTILKSMAEEVIVRRNNYTWEAHKKTLEDIYNIAENNFKDRQ